MLNKKPAMHEELGEIHLAPFRYWFP